MPKPRACRLRDPAGSAAHNNCDAVRISPRPDAPASLSTAAAGALAATLAAV